MAWISIGVTPGELKDGSREVQRINDTSERLVERLHGFEEVQCRTVDLLEEVLRFREHSFPLGAGRLKES